MSYLWHIAVLICIYAALASSLNLVVGYAGLPSLCQAAFYGIGAYMTSLLMLKLGLGFFAAMGLAVIGTGAISVLISVPALRLRGDYFVLGTLGFQIIVYGLLYNWVGLTNGSFGLSDIPAPSLFGVAIDSVGAYFYLSLFLSVLCFVIAWGIASSPFGRMLRAIRDDEIAAIAIAKNTVATKTIAFALSAALAAIPGALFAGYAGFIDPTSFTLTESILVLSMVVIGGAGSIVGPLIGSALLVLLPEALRYLHVQDAVAANARQMVYGFALIALMRLRPQGIAGKYRFD